MKVDPCIPAGWDGFEITRKFRGATYQIKVENPKHVSKGVAKVTIDGKPIESNVLPLFPKGGTHQMVVQLG